MQNFFNPDSFIFPFDEKTFDWQNYFPPRPVVKILVVVEQNFKIGKGPSNFGVARVVELIRENQNGFVHFELDVAVMGTPKSTIVEVSGPGPARAKYRNFRFSSQISDKDVIDSYDQLWCFGYTPRIDGPGERKGEDIDEEIMAHPIASTDEDLAVLSKWMDNGGGMLAMGDHYVLGASMCSRIPRVGSMRKWTVSQGVPPSVGTKRLDTNRPQNDSQDPYKTQNPKVIPFSVQGDDVPQKIVWKQYQSPSGMLFPHALLCAGKLGIIDVFPDHPHEGEIIDESKIDLKKKYRFENYSNSEYPKLRNLRPSPETIAWANILPHPPYNHVKGDIQAKQFGIVGVYDGDSVNIGRVVVDSTWHHWMDQNIYELENATPNTNFIKIARYYQNSAVWLARKHQRKAMLRYSTFFVTVSGYTFEDFPGGMSDYEAGAFALDILERKTSSCLVVDLSRLYLPPELIAELSKFDGIIPDRCLSCPFEGLALKYVVGGMINEQISYRDSLGLEPKMKIKAKKLLKLEKKGVDRGLQSFYSQLAKIDEVFKGMIGTGNLKNKKKCLKT